MKRGKKLARRAWTTGGKLIALKPAVTARDPWTQRDDAITGDGGFRPGGELGRLSDANEGFACTSLKSPRDESCDSEVEKQRFFRTKRRAAVSSCGLPLRTIHCVTHSGSHVLLFSRMRHDPERNVCGFASIVSLVILSEKREIFQEIDSREIAARHLQSFDVVSVKGVLPRQTYSIGSMREAKSRILQCISRDDLEANLTII